jgi:hypothetical protein
VTNEHQQRLSRVAVQDSVILAVACLGTFMLVTDVVPRVYHLSHADDLIGGLWAVIATVPFHPWALAVLTGLSVLAVDAIGRPGDAATAAITTAVVLVASSLSSQHAWQQPILRLADTVVGVGVGVAAAWLGLRLGGQRGGERQ